MLPPIMMYSTKSETIMYWSENDQVCELCGGEFLTDAERDEMYDPNVDDQSYIVHNWCGQARNWERA